MKKNTIYPLLLLCSFLISCASNNNSTTEKHQNNRNNIVNVSDKIVDVKTDIVFGNSDLLTLDSFLIVNEVNTNINKGVHLFNKNTFKYITSTGIRGQGPGEITRFGLIGIDHKNKVLWMTDNGKQLMYKFPLDSILNNTLYKPRISVKLNNRFFLDRYNFYNDSIVYGKSVEIVNDQPFIYMSRRNLNTDATIKYGYEHPKLLGTRANGSMFKLSVKDNLYINAFYNCDLLTICNLDGSLKYNIYGPDAFAYIKHGGHSYYCSGVGILDNYIIAGYVDDVKVVKDKVRGLVGNLPTKLLVFDMDGNYIETIETGNKFWNFCVDSENHRIVCYFQDRKNPLGYFNFNLK